ncbi:MAG: DUF2029 domain-containing protein [Candidatus Omnitrophica bacterium]|nr:DUF2029 domain-containing protein [Candidatus Omnitrophota bacterium]HPP02171.1 glycosyltransferase family 87 protein [bacterium]
MNGWRTGRVFLSATLDPRYGWALAVAVTGYTAYQFLAGVLFLNWDSGSPDFTAYYAAAQSLAAGRPVYPSDPWPLIHDNVLAGVSIGGVPNPYPTKYYLYPPLLAWMLQPVTYLPFPLAAKGWGIVLVLAYIGGIGWLFRLAYQQQWLNLRELFLLGLLAAYWAPAFFAGWAGQVTPLVMLLVIGHGIFAFHRRDIRAGVFLGMAVLLKISPIWFILLWVLQRRWTLIVSAALTAAVLILVSGWELNVLYFSRVLPHVALGENHPVNHSLMGTFLRVRLGEPWGWLRPEAYADIRVSHRIARGFALLAGMVTLWGMWRPLNARTWRLHMASLLAALIVLSPVVRLYDFVYLFPAVVLLFADLKQNPGKPALWILAFTVAANTVNLAGWLSYLAFDPITRDLLGRPSCLSAVCLWSLSIVRQKKVLHA